MVDPKQHAERITLLERLVFVTAVGCRVFPYTIEQYRAEIKSVELLLGLNFGWGPHSPRAGFASEARARGMAFSEIREFGRWVADSSLRVYLDLVSAASISVSLRSRGLVPALVYVSTYCLRYFELQHLASVYDSRFQAS